MLDTTFALVLATALVAPARAAAACHDTTWATIMLDPTIGFTESHRVEGRTLHLRLAANTSDFLGFGLAESTSGHMKGSDIVTAAAAEDISIVATDCYVPFAPTTHSAATNYENGFVGLYPFEDAVQDWEVVSGSEADGQTDVYLTRLLDS